MDRDAWRLGSRTVRQNLKASIPPRYYSQHCRICRLPFWNSPPHNRPQHRVLEMDSEIFNQRLLLPHNGRPCLELPHLFLAGRLILGEVHEILECAAHLCDKSKYVVLS